MPATLQDLFTNRYFVGALVVALITFLYGAVIFFDRRF